MTYDERNKPESPAYRRTTEGTQKRNAARGVPLGTGHYMLMPIKIGHRIKCIQIGCYIHIKGSEVVRDGRPYGRL